MWTFPDDLPEQDNVHFLNSAEMVKVLVKEGVAFDTMYYPNQDHSLSEGGAETHVWRTLHSHFLKCFFP